MGLNATIEINMLFRTTIILFISPQCARNDTQLEMLKKNFVLGRSKKLTKIKFIYVKNVMFFVLTVQYIVIPLYTCPNYFLLTQTTEPRQKFATNNVMSFFKKHFCCEEGNIKKMIDLQMRRAALEPKLFSDTS